MESSIKAIVLILAAVLCVSWAASDVFAQSSDRSFKSDAKKAGRAAVDYPSNVVTGSVNTVGKAAKGAADAVVGTVKATGETLTGDVKKAPEIVTTPVKGTAETVKNAVLDTVETPVKAGEKTKEQIQQ